MGLAGSILTIASSILQGVQGSREAAAQRAEGRYQQSIYDSNARIISEFKGEDSIYRGQQKADEIKLRGAKLIGSQRAALAAQGLDLGQDDALAIQQETAGDTAEDARQIKNNAWQEAWGFRAQALNDRTAGNFAGVTANQKATGTILTTGLNILNTFSKKN